jgi:hypothetical protein
MATSISLFLSCNLYVATLYKFGMELNFPRSVGGLNTQYRERRGRLCDYVYVWVVRMEREEEVMMELEPFISFLDESEPVISNLSFWYFLHLTAWPIALTPTWYAVNLS